MTSFFVPYGMPTGSGCRFGVRFFRIRQSRFYYISDPQLSDFIIFSLYPWRTMILLSESVASRASERRTKRFSYLDERATDSILLSFSWLNEPYDFLILTDQSDFNILRGTKGNPVKTDGIDFYSSPQA